MQDRVLSRLLNTYKIQELISRDDVPQLQVVYPLLLTCYMGQWGEESDENRSSET
jgi:hypothetical protein